MFSVTVHLSYPVTPYSQQES